MGALKSASASATTSNSASGSSYDTEEVIVKLAKKNDQAVLNIEIIGSTSVGRRVRVAHDVKIEVMKPVDVARLTEPMCPEPDVRSSYYFRTYHWAFIIPQIHIILPPLQKLRTIVERMRNMAEILAIRANHNGCLKLSIHTESVKIETEWQNLSIPQMSS